MTRYAPQLQLGLILGLLALGFWLSADAQQIAAGIALFLLGMVMLEDGFKGLGGSVLARVLQRATASCRAPWALGCWPRRSRNPARLSLSSPSLS
jgi:phosphate:Na+ symporter